MKQSTASWVSRLAALMGSIYLCLGALKLVSAVGELPILSKPNPILSPLTYRQVILVAGLCEVATGCLAWAFGSPMARLAATSWMTGILAAYRLVLLWTGVGLPCSCLGPAAAWLGWSAEVERQAGILLLLCLCSGCAVGWCGMLLPRGMFRRQD